MRDRALGSTVRVYFTTHSSSSVVVAPSSAFAASDFKIYKDGSATEKATTNGITVTSPFDSQTGAHLIEIDTSNSTGDVGFWASGSAYRVVISTAKTVDSKDPSGVCVGEFSLELQTADVRKLLGTAWLTPGTAGTPDVNVRLISGDSTAADNLEAAADGTGYNLGAGQVVAASVSGAVGSVSGAVGSVTGNVGGNVVGTVASVVTKTGYSLVAGTGLGDQTANITGSLSGSVGSVTGAVGSVVGNVGGNVNGSVASVAGNVSGSVGSVAGAVGSVTGSVGSVVGNVGGSVASVAGAVGSVTGNVGGDVAGKVLGGGSGTISGDGVRASSVTGAVGSVTGSVGSVVAAVSLDTSTNTKITDINTFATRMTTAISQDGLVWQFTVNALENAPSGGGGGGSATLANQEIIINMIDAYLVSITAAAQETPGTIAGFPATLNVGDSYTDEMDNAITITLVDDQDNPVDTWGDYDVNHAGFTPTLVISGSGGKVTATVTYDTDHFLVEIPSSESLRASPGTATMQFVLKWYVADRLVAQKTIVTGQAVTWIKQI